MNINDVNKPEEVPEDIWKAIFERQWALAIQYRDIEGMGDLLHDDFMRDNINTKFGQKWIKDFAWRVTEELAEADEAWMKHLHYLIEGKEELATQCLDHYFEELTDALHFLTELTLIAGYQYDFVPNEWTGDSVKQDHYIAVIYSLGLMCNCLKNKPWKQTQMLTDRPKFELYLKNAWNGMILCFYGLGLNNTDIYNLYFKKSSVNQFRIRSKY